MDNFLLKSKLLQLNLKNIFKTICYELFLRKILEEPVDKSFDKF